MAFSYYVGALIDPDGTPRYTPASPLSDRWPVRSLRRCRPCHGPRRSSRRSRSADGRSSTSPSSRLTRSDGAFVFQRERYWVNRTPHPRWVQAPMLEALTVLLAAEAESAP